MGDTQIASNTCESDLGDLVDPKLTMNQQCDAGAKEKEKANAILDYINRSIIHLIQGK